MSTATALTGLELFVLFVFLGDRLLDILVAIRC